MQFSDAPDAPDGDGILIDTAAGGPAGLFATHVAAATGENAHADDAHADDAHADDAHAGLLATHVADDAHADDAKADDLDLDAEDLTDKDGDGNGTASMPVKVSSYVGMGKGGSKYRSRRHKRYVRRDAEAISHNAYRGFRDYERSW